MDLKLIAATFTTIFIAELGDKTQLAAMSLSAKGSSLLEVFIGAMAGLALATILGMGAGRLLQEFLNPRVLQIGSGSLFIALGVLILWGKI